MNIILASTGEPIEIGSTHVLAVKGPHRGAWFRVDDVRRHESGWRVHASRKLRNARHRVACPPDVFGLVMQEALSFARHVLNILVTLRRKIDDGLILGALALIPLALFEAFHGGEAMRDLLLSWLGGNAEGGH